MTKKASLITSHSKNIEEIAALINKGNIIVIPYGKKERRVFAMVGSAHDPQVIKEMLTIKKRSSSQALAISGIPDAAPLAAKLNETKALIYSAKRSNKTPQEIVELCFQVGAVGLIFEAQDWLPKEVTVTKENGHRTVLIAGECTEEEFDIFPKVYRCLIEKYGKIMVGTSANLHGEETYHALEQDEAFDKLKDHVDVFVYDQTKIGRFPLIKHLTSTTMIDLTGDIPEVVRWGNVYPGRFKSILGDMIFEPKKLKKYKNREGWHHLLFKKIIPIKGLLSS